MILLLAACVRHSAPDADAETPPAAAELPAPTAVVTDSGRYQVRFEGRLVDGVLVVRRPDGSPETAAEVAVVVDGVGWLVDPGECDSVGEQRCDHPDGRYAVRCPEGWRPGPVATSNHELRVAVDGSVGLDRVALPRPP